MTTVGWGIAITVLALVADQIDRTVIEAINKIGSAFYGPVLATFAIGLFSKRVRGQVMLAGLLAGVGINVTAWLMAWPIHWMWWNVMGGTVTVVVAQGLSMGRASGTGAAVPSDMPVARWRAAEVRWATPLLLGGFALTLGLVIALR